MDADQRETPHDADDEDKELIAAIMPHVMACLSQRKFFEELDNRLCPEDESLPGESCQGNYAVSESILISQGFDDAERADIFDVLKAQGGFCDCEILYNVLETNRLKAKYWRARAKEYELTKPHEPAR